MSLKIVKSPDFLADTELQFEWYLENAGGDVANRFVIALDEALRRIARQPRLAPIRRFRAPALKGIRSCLVGKPFQVHLVFYRLTDTSVEIFRVMHGARDLPRRLQQPP